MIETYARTIRGLFLQAKRAHARSDDARELASLRALALLIEKRRRHLERRRREGARILSAWRALTAAE